MKVDLLAVGGGFAGLVAEMGDDFGLAAAVIERGSEADYICNSRISTGVFHCWLWDVQESPDVLYDRIMGIAYGACRSKLCSTSGRASQ